jgi:hypothetical protein
MNIQLRRHVESAMVIGVLGFGRQRFGIVHYRRVPRAVAEGKAAPMAAHTPGWGSVLTANAFLNTIKEGRMEWRGRHGDASTGSMGYYDVKPLSTSRTHDRRNAVMRTCASGESTTG